MHRPQMVENGATSEPLGPPPSLDRQDAAALTAVRAGDARPFRDLVDRHKHRLHGYLRSRVSDAGAAEDLTQEVFLRAFRAARSGGFAGRARVSTWLFTIAGNCLRDHGRWRRRQQEHLPCSEQDPAGLDATSPEPGPLERSVHREQQQRIDRWLAALPDPQQQVVAMKVFGELTFAEIAEVTGVPVATVKSRMRYGLLKIEQMLRSQQGGEP